MLSNPVLLREVKSALRSPLALALATLYLVVLATLVHDELRLVTVVGLRELAGDIDRASQLGRPHGREHHLEDVVGLLRPRHRWDASLDARDEMLHAVGPRPVGCRLVV